MIDGKKKLRRGICIGRERNNDSGKVSSKGNIVAVDDGDDGESNGGGGARAFKEEADAMSKKAEKYQVYLKQIPIPASTTTKKLQMIFFGWLGLAPSPKDMREQPLHRLTHGPLEEWDRSRVGIRDDEIKPLDRILHPGKAEATNWVVDQVHRQCTSIDHLAKPSGCQTHCNPDSVDPFISNIRQLVSKIVV